MILYSRWSSLAFGRVNAFVPAAGVVVGCGCFLVGYRWIGAGIAIGAILALVNGVLLSGRVEVAAASGDIGRALLTMQLGLLITFTIIAIATVILVHISLPLTVAAALAFVVTHIAMLATFFWTRARTGGVLERNA